MRKKAILFIERTEKHIEYLTKELIKNFSPHYDIETIIGEEAGLATFNNLVSDGVEIPVIILSSTEDESLIQEITRISPKTFLILLTEDPQSDFICEISENEGLFSCIKEPWLIEDLLLTVRQAIKSYYREKNLSSIISISQHISAILDIEELLERIMVTAVGISGAQRGYLFMFDEKSQELEVRASQNISGMSEIPQILRYLVDKVFGTGKELLIVDNNVEDDYVKYEDIANCGLLSVICLPVIHQGRKWGVCYLDNPIGSAFFTEDDVEMLKVLMTQAGIAIENAGLYKGLENKVKERTKELRMAYSKLNEAHNELKKDLLLAKRVQKNILPKNLHLIKHFDFFIKYIPMGEVGGDFYDISTIGDDYIRIFIADATGHGVQAALITMVIKEEYERLKSIMGTPSDLIHFLNNEFIRTYETMEMFFTCFVVDIDLKGKRLTYTSAGHPPQLLIHGNEVINLCSTGAMIGTIENFPYKINDYSFSIEDRLILFTDGAYEQFNTIGEEYGQDRLIGNIKDNKYRPVEDILEEIMSDLNLHMTNNKVNDDITIIGVTPKNDS
jgi:serine phosphatase RsbU (regulator of sigma subunit)